MNYSLGRAVRWIGLFFVLSLLPLALALLGPVPPPRAFLVELGVALGFIGLALMAVQFVFSGRLKWVAPHFGMDNIIQFHKEMGIAGVLFLLAHPVLLLAADASFLEYFDPRVNFLRALFLSIVTLALIAIIVTSLWRQAIRLSYEWWRLIHGGLAGMIVFIGVVHAVQVSHYLGTLWKQVALVLLVAPALTELLLTRIYRPWRSRKRPYRVVSVTEERDDSWSLTMEPAGGERMRFVPGQFTWMTLGPTPFTLQQHPFSFSGSAARDEITLTAKELGDFTGTWGDVEEGTLVFLEGPFGSFIPDPSPDTGLFLVMGGIGVTPAMSMIRTIRDTGETRKVILLYGNKDWENVAFREELDELTREMDLEVVHILEEPHDEWEGEEGFVTKEILEKHLPDKPLTFQYFVCGPGPLMDVTETSLRELGIPWERMYAERFEIV